MCWLKALDFELAHQPSWQIMLLSAFSADLSWCRPNSGTTSVLLVSEHDSTFVISRKSSFISALRIRHLPRAGSVGGLTAVERMAGESKWGSSKWGS